MRSLLPESRCSTRPVGPARGVSGWYALIACLTVLLQLVSALHFTLVPHSFSAALGGVVHLHGQARQSAEPRRAPGPPLVSQSSVSCAVDLCPYADAPPSSPPCAPCSATGSVTFGEARLLAKAEARTQSSRRVFSRAPKTSPPV